MNPKQSNWTRIWIVFLAGCIAAFQIGKVSASLAVMIPELEMSIVQAGMVVSVFMFMNAMFGIGCGAIADWVGHLRIAIGGLLLSASGAFLGAGAQSFDLLLLSRLIEGLGFILAIVALPSLMSASASDRDRPIAMGLWGAFVPVGMGGFMLFTPAILPFNGWRGVWIVAGICLVLWTIVVYVSYRKLQPQPSDRPTLRDMKVSLLKPGTLFVLGGFTCYSGLYVSLASFFPTMLVTHYQLDIGVAAQLGALIVLMNAIGNVAAGWLIVRGIKPVVLLYLSLSVMGVCGVLVFSTAIGPFGKTLAGIGFSIVGGLYPGTAFVLAARFAVKPSHMALMAGAMLQGAGFGQSMGPMAVGALVDGFGAWDYANIFMVSVALLGLALIIALNRRVFSKEAE